MEVQAHIMTSTAKHRPILAACPWRERKSWNQVVPGYELLVQETHAGYTARVFHLASGLKSFSLNAYRSPETAQVACQEAVRRHRADPDADELFPEAA